ncbi:MAG: TonB-dependent receptor plug domain-containing protein, partial [bacterium]
MQRRFSRRPASPRVGAGFAERRFLYVTRRSCGLLALRARRTGTPRGSPARTPSLVARKGSSRTRQGATETGGTTVTDRKHVSQTLETLSWIVAAWIAVAPSTAFPQQEDPASEETAAEEEAVAGDEAVEELVVTGTRKAGVAVTETLSPVDMLSSATVSNQASFDLTDGIGRIAPSFNTQRFPIADGTSFIRPVTLRNLSPDHTLVLVNGTRRHRSALVNLQLAPLGTVNQGSQAVDFSTLPAAAIERIEVLRDGASAQYGSDAIAGVVNVILKDDPRGISGSVQTGEYYEGDGTRTSVDANGGFPLTEKGFLNAALEYSSSDKTWRGAARPDAQQVAGVVGVEQVPLDGLGQRWGDPDVEIWKAFANAEIEVAERVDLYSHGSFARNETISDFFYRGPVLDPVHMFDARTTLQIDEDGDFLPDTASVALVNDIVGAG